MRECILNPETKRCVFKDGAKGKEIMKKYGNIPGCVYDETTNRCVKQSSPSTSKQQPAPKQQPVPKLDTDLSLAGKQHLSKIVSSQRLSNIFKGVPSRSCEVFETLTKHGFKIKTVEVVDKKSASDTIILKITTEQALEIIAKIGVQVRDPRYDSLFAENFIYKFLDKFNLPFTVEYIKQLTCTHISKFIQPLNPGVQQQFANRFVGYMSRTFNILLTKLCSNNCKTLFHLLTKTTPFIVDVNAILLQGMFTLAYFQEIGLQHNDLHLNNMFVEETPCNMTLKFKEGIEYSFYTKYVLKVYDFDLASIVPTPLNYNTSYENPRLTYLTEKRICMSNNTNKGKRDTAQFILNLSRTVKTDFLTALSNVCIPESLETASKYNDLIHPGHACRYESSVNGFKLWPGIKSARTAMLTYKFTSVQLTPPKQGLFELKPILPSLATTCSEYTTMINCIKPQRSPLSSEQKAKFRKAIIQTSKILKP